MITTATTPPAGTGPGAMEGEHQPSRHLWLVLVLAVAIIAIAVLSWIYFHPGDAFDRGGAMVGKSDAHSGTTYYFGTGIQATRSVTVSQVVPLLDGHSALAAVAVVACGPSTWQIGDGTLSQCVHPREVQGTRVTADLNSPYFVVAVTPLTPGVVKMNGFEVVYADHTRQSSHAGNTIEIQVRA